MGFESTDFEERSSDVLGKVLESESVATQVFGATVDSFGGVVRGVGIREVGRAVPHSAFDRLAQRDVVSRAARYTRGDQYVDFGLHLGLSGTGVGLAVSIDHVLVDAPRNLYIDMFIASKQVESLLLLTWRDQA